ncbi:unnamed protein product [Thelazia callipaeda]|uniref:RNA-binding protein 25-like n=1 Tax=Thelazia callipaeda TaxID=103827 RepID=A0A0N5CUX3_THECL|nr:unnamed protein product [Thelazia callipaeda]
MSSFYYLHRDFDLQKKQLIKFNECLAQPKVLAQSLALAALSSLGTESDDDSYDEIEIKQVEKLASKTTEQETSKNSNVIEESGGYHKKDNGDDAVFNVPLLPLPSSGAKSKAKLSSNDGLSSTKSFQGVDELWDKNVFEKIEFYGSQRLFPSVEHGKFAMPEEANNNKESCIMLLNNEDVKKVDLGRVEDTKKREKKKQSRGSKKLQNLENRERSRKQSSSEKSVSKTPERYRRRSSSKESCHKRRRSHDRKRSKSRTRKGRRYVERHISRSRSRERRRTGEGHYRDKYFRRSRS